MPMPIGRRSALTATGAALAAFGLRDGAEAQAGKGRTFLIFFDFEASEVSPSAKEIVLVVGKVLQPNAKVILAGNADSAEKNPDRLSLARASEVLKALAALDVPKGVQFTVIGRGNASPLVKTSPGVRDPQNRRVEITVA